MKLFMLLSLFFSSLFAEVDRSVSSFERTEKKLRVDQFDFSGEWPNLENIAIDGKRKKVVEMDLSGSYPLLKKISFEGGFGILDGLLTGEYPELSTVQFLCGSRKMTFDLTAQWKKDCEMTFVGGKEDITLLLPASVNLIIDTKVALKGKVYVEGLTKKGHGVLKKRYEKVSDHEVTLYIYVETSEGHIHLNVDPS